MTHVHHPGYSRDVVTRRTTAPKRLDRAAAKAYYVSLEPGLRSFPAVAAKFGVSDTTVRKWARREGWDDLAHQGDERAAAKALEQGMRTREQRAVQTARIRDLAADRLERGIEPDESGGVALDDNVVLAVWKEADRQYRLDIGEATSRLEIHEVHEYVRRLMFGIDDVLADELRRALNGKSAPVLAAIRERFTPLLEQTVSGGESAD